MIDQFVRIKLGSKSIDRANFVKYLGILVDSTLNWKPHVTELSIHNRNTRQASKGNIFISSVYTAQYGKRTPKFAGSVMWNNLPPPLRECPSSRNFKKCSESYISLCTKVN